MARGIRGVLFDKDGVLFDFQRTWGGWARQVVDHFAGGDDALADRIAGVLGVDRATGRILRGAYMVAHTGPETAARLAELLPGHDAERVFAVGEALSQRTEPVPTVPLGRLFDDLHRRGLKIGLATNGSEAEARAQLGRLGVVECFDFLAGFDSGHGAKPDPGMCVAFARDLALDPGACVMVGDSTHDLHAGAAAGFICVGVLTGVAVTEDLAPFAEVVLPDIAALEAWIDHRG